MNVAHAALISGNPLHDSTTFCTPFIITDRLKPAATSESGESVKNREFFLTE